MPDMRAEGDASSSAIVKLAGARTMLSVPMLKEDDLVGSIGIYRQEVSRFTDKQIALLQNFAAQAVIAIENARLLNELRQRTTDLTERTTDLTEALEQQTATSEVLQVISSSPGDLQPVFATMLAKAVRICDATFGNIYRLDGDAFNLVAAHNTPPALVESRKRSPLRLNRGSLFDHMLETKAALHAKAKQNPATACMPSTTRSAATTFWRTPMPSAAPTRARRGWTVRTSRPSRRMGWSDGWANWRLRSGRRLTDRTLSDAFTYRRPTASSGRWASQPCGIGSA